ncbi:MULTISPECIES: ParB/RepB/Spo0J family partition protein [unclassified Staphylococcus]|uniref:ParB/RepB/Spo0J family partition protein n=1 Tax=unclassified Staphylococcus TaxID=91994 RepID=UPI0021CE90FC|nr:MULTISPECIES: ParB/RepB/Spo0J family partition protein [unclassified Staphylococcus]UXR77319.1 ParB/RepB/Spo0J family partition protein [Staphylococcus sp. IVB6233]UXR80426.1 ParB/RepB/Spo0J family partition protein [Staphylococcus sp. IVB6218]
MSDVTSESGSEQVKMLSLTEIRPNPYQPRKNFDRDKLLELSQSIVEHGVLQPIVVTPSIQGYYIVAGERRYRASEQAGLTHIPAIVREMTDHEMRELAIIENLQRENLNPVEEAESYQQLMEAHHMTQHAVAERLGKSRPYIANMLRLLKLPTSIRQLIREGTLSGGHGRTLLGLRDPKKMQQYADLAVRESWSVRYLEQRVAEAQPSSTTKTPSASTKKPQLIRQHEQQLSEKYGTSVDIATKRNKGQVTFTFHSEADYRRLIQLLKKQ